VVQTTKHCIYVSLLYQHHLLSAAAVLTAPFLCPCCSSVSKGLHVPSYALYIYVTDSLRAVAMELEQLMARARHRAHFTQARERRRVEKQQWQQRQRRQRPEKAEASILKFAAAPAARVSAQGTQVLLPDSVLGMVMASLASCLEPGGVYGPSLVARDLANASLVRQALFSLLLLLLLLASGQHACIAAYTWHKSS
jgi:hypothetical protein